MFHKSQDEIMKNWDINNLSPKLTVICITYNHEKYIEEAIDSMLMQETNFPFEIIIGEDCSPDSTKNILIKYTEKYPLIIKSILRDENVGAFKNEEECILLANGEYIAFLEGDDFWIDKLKLQKQVDFLDKNPEYGLVHGDVNHLEEKGSKLKKGFNQVNNVKIPNGDIYDFLLKPSHSIKTMTVCLRKELLTNYYFNNPKIMKQNWKLIDISLWLIIAKYSKIYYFKEVFSTYRLLEESASRTKNYRKLYSFHTKIHSLRLFFFRTYGGSKEIKKILYLSYYNSLFFDGYNLDNKKMMYRGEVGLNFFQKKLSLKHKVYKCLIFLRLNKIITRFYK